MPQIPTAQGRARARSRSSWHWTTLTAKHSRGVGLPSAELQKQAFRTFVAQLTRSGSSPSSLNRLLESRSFLEARMAPSLRWSRPFRSCHTLASAGALTRRRGSVAASTARRDLVAPAPPSRLRRRRRRASNPQAARGEAEGSRGQVQEGARTALARARGGDLKRSSTALGDRLRPPRQVRFRKPPAAGFAALRGCPPQPKREDNKGSPRALSLSGEAPRQSPTSSSSDSEAQPPLISDPGILRRTRAD